MEIMHKGMWTGRRVLYLSVDAIRANPDQPRKYFEPEALRELAESIGRYGILQPLTVRRGEDGYELIAGERRLRAAMLAGTRAPAARYDGPFHPSTCTGTRSRDSTSSAMRVFASAGPSRK